MIKAVIFDCFGVLASDGWLPFKNKYFGENSELFEQSSKLSKKVDTGLMGYDDFIRKVAKMADVSEAKAKYYIEHNVPDEKLFDYIKELKKKYKVGMLSNAGDNWLDEIFTKEQTALFDAVALSYEMGFIKPDPRAYKVIAERLSVKPSECVFIDDQVRYCEGAEEQGMEAVLYENFPQLKKALEQILSKKS